MKHRKNPVFMRVCGVYRSLLITAIQEPLFLQSGGLWVTE